MAHSNIAKPYAQKDTRRENDYNYEKHAHWYRVQYFTGRRIPPIESSFDYVSDRRQYKQEHNAS